MCSFTLLTAPNGDLVTIEGCPHRNDELAKLAFKIVQVVVARPDQFAYLARAVEICQTVEDIDQLLPAIPGGSRMRKRLLREYYRMKNGQPIDDRRGFLVEEIIAALPAQVFGISVKNAASVQRSAKCKTGKGPLPPQMNGNLDVVFCHEAEGSGVECKAKLSSFIGLSSGGTHLSSDAEYKLSYMKTLRDHLQGLGVVFHLWLGTFEPDSDLQHCRTVLDRFGYSSIRCAGSNTLDQAIRCQSGAKKRKR